MQIDYDYEDNSSDFYWMCELDPMDVAGHEGIILPFERGYNLPDTVFDNNNSNVHEKHAFISGKFTMAAPDLKMIIYASDYSACIVVPDGVTPSVVRIPPYVQNHRRRRQLVITEGKMPILVVRITGPDTSTTMSSAILSDVVFGTSGDTVNLRSQFAACSNSKVSVEPGGDQTGASLAVIDGVVEVTISDTINGTDHNTIRNSVTNVLTSNGFNIPGNYHHIMYCFPPGTTGAGAAYAFINHWLSVYNDNVCASVTFQMHEIGHNLNLGHSGERSDEYGDRSGVMGYSSGKSGSPRMCFNGPKNWQLGWYNDRQTTVNPLVSGWSGELVAITDYANSAGRAVILKMNTDSAADYYVTFNRKHAFNSGTKEGRDQVLITLQGGEGNEYAKSILLAKLYGGESYSISNFGGTNQTVTILVESIFPVDDITMAARVTVSGTSLTTTPPPPSFAPTKLTCVDLQTRVTYYYRRKTRMRTEHCSSLGSQKCQKRLVQGGRVFEICQATCSRYNKIRTRSNWIDCSPP